MLNQIKGIHHVTSLASGAQANNDFITKTLGLRRVKKTVNFDRPELYHLYYGDERGTPGTVMTYFPNPNANPRQKGAGEVSATAFSIPRGACSFWSDRLRRASLFDISDFSSFGEIGLRFVGLDGDEFLLIETDDMRAHWQGSGIVADHAVRGFHSVSLRLQDIGATAELLQFMGYKKTDQEGQTTRFQLRAGNEAQIIDLETTISEPARQGAGSVHHIAFAVENRHQQIEVRDALISAGFSVTPVKNRNYFWAIYFREPGGILFEIATNEPGFEIDENIDVLGKALRLPPQHEPRRAELMNKHLELLAD